MPRFHFNVRDGELVIPDEEGMRLPDIETAREEARKSARDLVAQDLNAKQDGNASVIEITDDIGRVIETFKIRDLLH